MPPPLRDADKQNPPLRMREREELRIVPHGEYGHTPGPIHVTTQLFEVEIRSPEETVIYYGKDTVLIREFSMRQLRNGRDHRLELQIPE